MDAARGVASTLNLSFWSPILNRATSFQFSPKKNVKVADNFKEESKELCPPFAWGHILVSAHMCAFWIPPDTGAHIS